MNKKIKVFKTALKIGIGYQIGKRIGLDICNAIDQLYLSIFDEYCIKWIKNSDIYEKNEFLRRIVDNYEQICGKNTQDESIHNAYKSKMGFEYKL